MWKFKSNSEIPKKPETQKEQISMLWDFVTNHIFTRVCTHDMKINFILILTGLILAFIAILVSKG